MPLAEADAILPVVERIALAIVAALEGVTAAAGADRTLTVERPRGGRANSKRDATAVLVQGSPAGIRSGDDSPTGQGPANGMDEWLQPFAIVVTVTESESSDTAIDTRLNIIRSEIEQRLADDPQFGGLALDSWPSDPEYVDHGLDASIGEIWIPLTVYYRTLTGNPFKQGG